MYELIRPLSDSSLTRSAILFLQLGKSFSKGGGGKVEDVQYLRAKYMLENLGLGVSSLLPTLLQV